MVSKAGLITAFLIALAAPALAQQPPDGAAVFKRACANCHADESDERADSRNPAADEDRGDLQRDDARPDADSSDQLV